MLSDIAAKTHTFTAHINSPHTEKQTIVLLLSFFFSLKAFSFFTSHQHTHTLVKTHTYTHTNKLSQLLPLNLALSTALEPDMRPGTEEMSDVNQYYNAAEPTT